MTHSLKKSIALAASLAGLLGAPAIAGVIDDDLATRLEGLADNELASAIVYLSDQPDIQALDAELRIGMAPMSVRHERVISTLRAAADRSQPELLNYLSTREAEGTVEGFTPYWIMNLIVVSATKGELQRIAARSDVDAIEVNFRATLIGSVHEPYLGNPTLGIGVTNSLRAINADRVWNELGITGAGTLIGGLDTGVEGTHPALAARWRGNFHPWQECWRDALGGGTQFPNDGNGHGTHTMGSMCGVDPATGDTVGVAFAAQWIADNSINQGVGSAFDNDVLGAFQWFTDPDGNSGTTDDVPDVVQNSWGSDARFGGTYQDCDFRWQTAIQNCEAAGVVVTFSSGNEGPGSQTHRSPANIINTPVTNFAVGAVDAESFNFPYPIANFSSRGPSDCDGVTIKPEVSAPGVNVYSSYVGGGYARLSGTSMAGPHVAGVVALMRQANPNADVQTIKTALMNTSRDQGTAGEDNTFGRGVIDAYAAVLAVMAPDTEPPTVTVVAPNGGETLTVGNTFAITWNATDNIGVTQSDVYYSVNGGGSYSLIASLSGNPGSYNWTVPNTPTTQGRVRVDAFDLAGHQATDASNGNFTIQAPSGPYLWVESISLSLVPHGPNVNAKATVIVRDQNGSPAGNAQVNSHWSGLSGDSDVFVTKANGSGTCNSDRVRSPNGCWTLTIDNVVKAGYTFRNDLGETTDVICTSGALPNPSGGTTLTISESHADVTTQWWEFVLNLPTRAHVTTAIYSTAGRKVRTLVDETLQAGSRSLAWNGTDESGAVVPSGVYWIRVTAGDQSASSKVTVVK